MKNIWVYGINHKVAPLVVRERLAFGGERLQQALCALQQVIESPPECSPGLAEVVLLSTCNRTEVYICAPSTATVQHQVARCLTERAGMQLSDLADLAYIYSGRPAAAHLFRVSAGLDSLILGECEVLGQVKQAWRVAQDAGTCGPTLDALFRHAIQTGKRIRSETELSRTGLSLASMVVELAREAIGSLEKRTALIIGAGKISALAARALVEAGLQCVLVANRTFPRAEKLARSLGARRASAVHFDALHDRLAEADIVICSTGAPHLVLHLEAVRIAMAARPQNPLLVVDLAVPRDADPEIKHLENVHLVDIDDLHALVQRHDPLNQATRVAAAGLVEAGVADFTAWWRERQAAPLIKALCSKADEICETQVEQTVKRLGLNSPEQRQAIEKMAAAISSQLLHAPIQYVKTSPDELAPESTQTLLERLFDLN